MLSNIPWFKNSLIILKKTQKNINITENNLQHQQLDESFAELSEPIRISSSVMKFAVIRSLVLMKLQIFSINERIRMGSESSAKFSTIVGVEEYFL